jgi:hypothetical protein
MLVLMASRSLDDLILTCQRGLDRLIRRLRRGAAPVRTHRRLLIVQIDGLSESALRLGLARGRMPFLRHMLDRHGYRLEPMSVGVPTSTPAFQMAAMYGVPPNIPGFHYYDRERGGDIHFPRSGHAAWVEERQAAGRPGIVRGGSTYGCVFTGGADNNFFSFTSLTRPSGRGLLSALSPFVVLGWVAAKSTAYTVVELTRALLRFVANPADGRQGWRWVTIKIGMSVWVRSLFTLAVSRDLYEGTPVVYVNYLDYDVAAHAFGPRSRRALRSLHYVDRAIHQLWRVLRRVPEHRYDIYVLADHGQAHAVPYRDLSHGRRLEQWLIEQLPDLPPADAAKGDARLGLARGLRSRAQDTRGGLQRFLNYMDEDFLRRRDPEAYQRNGVRAIAAGPNAFFYALDAPAALEVLALEHRFPGFAEDISRNPGVGFVLARGREGPVCFWRGKRFQLRESDPGPFAGRPDAALVVRGIADLMAMPSAGDLVIYGIDAPEGHVSFIPEVGAHAGTSPEEMQTFIVHPAHVTLPSPITHPLQLYDHFIRYQSARPRSSGTT